MSTFTERYINGTTEAEVIKGRRWDIRYKLHVAYLEEINKLIADFEKGFEMEEDAEEKEYIRTFLNEAYALRYEVDYHVS